jgi:hypothetical protein
MWFFVGFSLFTTNKVPVKNLVSHLLKKTVV